jgi:inorganic pyrophosphatase
MSSMTRAAALSRVRSRAAAPQCARALSAAAHSGFAAPLFLTDAATRRRISPWHDVPLRPRGQPPAVLNFVCEIPKGAQPPKLEVDPAAPLNAIVQDKNKDGSPRRYRLDTLIHYGCLPQTYEDPSHKDRWTGLLGDGDPVDVCDISTGLPAHPGRAYRVKVIGALAMIDGGETDWKILAVRADDPLAARVDDVADALKTPAAVLRLADEVREWFRLYKVPEGKGENSFAFEGRWLGRDTALDIVADTHEQYRRVLAAPRAAKPAKGAPWLPPADGLWAPPQAGFLQNPGDSADLLTGTATGAE